MKWVGIEKKEKEEGERGAREKRREEGLNRHSGRASSWQLAVGSWQPTVKRLMRCSGCTVSKSQNR